MKRILAISAFCASLFGANVEIKDAFAKASIPGVQNTGVFFKVKNNENKDIKIISAHYANSAKTELHTHVKDGDMMKMIKVPSFKIPAKGEFSLRPGAEHVMLIGLKNPLISGEKIELELGFSDGSRTLIKDIEVMDIEKMRTQMKGHINH